MGAPLNPANPYVRQITNQDAFSVLSWTALVVFIVVIGGVVALRAFTAQGYIWSLQQFGRRAPK